MKEVTAISKLPAVPAVYALYGSQGHGEYVAYVGQAAKLRQRIMQHLVQRNSSVVTGASAVSLNPDLVSEVRWWHDPSFEDPTHLSAAELVAFDVLQPVLRSRGAVTDEASTLSKDERFSEPMRHLFQKQATGRLAIPTLDSAMERIAALESRVKCLEAMLGKG